ncbi:MAG: hypothetical protein ACM3MD_12920 [Betaproteobacteria bacterium]
MKDLDDRFALIEDRVRALLAKNKNLSVRINELEQELAQAQRESRELERLHGKKLHIRQRIENILHALESIGARKQER